MGIVIPSWLFKALFFSSIIAAITISALLIKNRNRFTSSELVILLIITWLLPLIGPAIVLILLYKKNLTSMR